VTEPLEPLLYRIHDVAALLAIGQTKVYRLVKDGALHAVRVGGVIRIPRESVVAYLASLPSVGEPVDDPQEALVAR
jgi:excisionase family DNA binding protein